MAASGFKSQASDLEAAFQDLTTGFSALGWESLSEHTLTRATQAHAGKENYELCGAGNGIKTTKGKPLPHTPCYW